MAHAPAHASGKGVCVICGLEDYTNKHHLVPRKYRKPGQRGRTVKTCYRCHAFIHATFTNKQLAERWNTVKKLRRHVVVRAWVSWRQKMGTENRVY